MPLTAMLKLVVGGQKIKGTVLSDNDEFKDLIAVRSMHHQIKSNVDLETGMPKSGRVHSTFAIVKKIDIASPFIMQAFRDNIAFTDWILKYNHMPSNGPSFDHASVKLTDARVVGYKMTMPHLGVPANSQVHEYEEISFQYESISWGFNPHPQDPSPGGNANFVGDKECFPETNWFEEEAKAYVLGMPKIILQAKKALWSQYHKDNPAAPVPAEYKD
ncbi:MAG TPA: type VI secretion system tube protein TssD [Planctomycetota bacterium]|nr:type VI secretion system tube protein TssD [Planctomycetota bacterium]